MDLKMMTNNYSRKAMRLFRVLGVGVLLIVGGVACLDGMSRMNIWDSKEGNVLLQNPSISADNKFMLFSFDYFKSGGGTRTTIVLYDIANDIISPFPLPREVAWNEPAFSPNGKYLAVAGGCVRDCPKGMAGGFIALVDIQSDFLDENNRSVIFKLIDRAKGQFYENPAFSPDGKYLYYVEYKTTLYKGKHGRKGKPSIKRITVEGGESETLYSGIESPVSVPQTVDLNPLINGGFMVNALFWPEVTKKLVKEKRMRRGHSSSVVYLRPSQAGSLLTESNEHPWAHQFDGIKRVSVSSNGRIIFTERSQDVDRDPETGYFSYDFFVVDDNMVRQLTHIRKVTSEYSISPDGSTIAALVNDKSARNTDIWIIDATTGEGKATGLRDKLLKLVREEHPDK